MDTEVNATGSRRGRQIARTEQRILAAAQDLFLENGYVATTLAAIAEAADVGPRTVYVRFGTKVALFSRVVDVAVAGDTQEIDVLHRDWLAEAMAAPTAEQRIALVVAGGRAIVQRAGALFAVAQQAAAVEPEIADQWQRAREDTRQVQHVFWTRMADDGLLPPAEVDRVTDTASVLCAAETYLLVTRMLGWDLDTYETWLRDSLTALTAATSTSRPSRRRR
ncbi:MAG TPA: helix-turn-helix domain-containing protein [Pseudonocardiaceae bacterium]|jgi:AcrR family transcriptional regulator|nr:helix-turn-helix domain-containing protein [Pseudonocardiaceae bacterium]